MPSGQPWACAHSSSDVCESVMLIPLLLRMSSTLSGSRSLPASVSLGVEAVVRRPENLSED
jgi:hypothetical protein